MGTERLDYDASILHLRGAHWLAPDEAPILPGSMPRHDDEVLGLNFFRTRVQGGHEFSGLTIPRTFFGRSEIRETSFVGTDLSESNLCWNEFIQVDFTDASLARADLRSSNYEDVRFNRCDLRGADLRLSRFNRCDFRDARMEGALVTSHMAAGLGLSDAQTAAIDWQDLDGPEPGGG